MLKTMLPSLLTFGLSGALLCGCTSSDNSAASGGGGAAASAASPSTAAAPAAGAQTLDPNTAATISGTIFFDGEAPAPASIDMSGTAECAAQHPSGQMSQGLEVNGGKIKNVIVAIKDGLSGDWNTSASAGPAVLDQKGCMYSPHVMVAQVNQALSISNSDPLTHNVHAMPKKSDPFNIGQPKASPPDTKHKFKAAEIVKFRCDVHGWMSCYVGVFDHPFASVSKDDGSFTMRVPPGEYTIQAWQEKLGTLDQKVKVGAKEQKTVDFHFKPQS